MLRNVRADFGRPRLSIHAATRNAPGLICVTRCDYFGSSPRSLDWVWDTRGRRMNFTQVRAGTIDPIDFQCILSSTPAPLGTPTSVVLTRVRAYDRTTLSNVTLTVQDATNGKVRWIPTAGQVVLNDQGYA